MHQEYLMGNEAIALGALASGVNCVAGYPGTPSTEVLETVAKRRTADTYVEWSVNEKAAMEIAAGASYSGARALVTMKQVGLNVASDPLMSLEYIGVEGGLVILVADDPGPISSQTEQDTRHFASFSKVPCLDPSSPEEAYRMIQYAFELSEEYHTPVFLRPTTRICHAYASLNVKDPEEYLVHPVKGFEKDPGRWVIFPRLSLKNHGLIVERNRKLSEIFSGYEGNGILRHGGKTEIEKTEDTGKRNTAYGIAASGVSYAYALEMVEKLPEEISVKLLKIGTSYPFPETLAETFLKEVDRVLCIEELDPVIEDALIYTAGKKKLNTDIYGKNTGHINAAGENTRDKTEQAIIEYLGLDNVTEGDVCNKADIPDLPVRPPVLCAGCPHRASFYAVKQAMKGKKAVFCGDIGCYTLGNAMPLDMVDTCLCMGAGVNITQGIGHLDPDTVCFAFVGDSTFFASAITGAVNAVYNQADMTLIILDNSTTAMTGHQPHPGTGFTMMGEVVEKVSVENTLRGIGVREVETVNPLNHEKAVETVRRLAALPGVKAIIFKYPCIAIASDVTKRLREAGCVNIDPDKCIQCRKCIREIGCPALIIKDGRVAIDETLCTGCGLCKQICPVNAISGGDDPCADNETCVDATC